MHKRLHYASILFQIVRNKHNMTLKHTVTYVWIHSQNGQINFKKFSANAADFYVVLMLRFSISGSIFSG